MFDRLVIKLTAGICSCVEADLDWCMRADDDDVSFAIRCAKCGTVLSVPQGAMTASFEIASQRATATSGVGSDAEHVHEPQESKKDGKLITMFRFPLSGGKPN